MKQQCLLTVNLNVHIYIFLIDYIFIIIYSVSSLSYDRSKVSSKASSPHSAIQSFLLQMRVWEETIQEK